MNTPWTPGPWQVTHRLSLGLIQPVIENQNGFRLATVNAVGDKETIEANTRLISLAPELVEALRTLDKAFWPAANGWGDDIQDAIQEAHNLLSKLDLAPTEAHGKP